MGYALAQRKNEFPFPSDHVWHKFFYELKKDLWLGKRFDFLRFDWDGPEPLSPELAEVLASLITAGSCVFDSGSRCLRVNDYTKESFLQKERALVDFDLELVEEMTRIAFKTGLFA